MIPVRPRLVELVESLEAMWADPDTADIVELSALIADRQGVLTEIQNSDATALDPKVRAALAQRIERVQARDQELFDAVRLRCDKILESLEAVVVARTAARGYAAAEDDHTPYLDRIA